MAQPMTFDTHYQIDCPRLPHTYPQKYQYETLTATTSGSYPDGVRYNLQQYSSIVQNHVYDLVKQLFEGESCVEFSEAVTYQVFDQVVDCICLDFPELLVDSSVKMNLVDGKIVSAVFNRYSDAESAEVRAAINQLVGVLRAECANTTQLDAARVVYRYLVEKMSYTTECNQETSSAQCIIAKMGNSHGIAKLFQLLCNELRIRCITKKMVVGKRYVNYFNCVLANERWGNVDCALAIQMRKDAITMGYFCFPDQYLSVGEVSGYKPPCIAFENMDFYRFGGLLVDPQNELQRAYKHVANCYLAGMKSADFLIVASDPKRQFDAVADSLCFGAARYLDKISFDVRNTSTSYYKEVPVCRINFVQVPLPRAIIPLQIDAWSPEVSRQLVPQMEKALKDGYRTVYLVFGEKVNYYALEKSVCAGLFKVFASIKGVEAITNFNYCGHPIAKVFELQM